MDNKTEHRLTKMEGKIELLEKESDSWNSLIKGVVIKIVTWLIMMGGSGIIFGWQLPPDVRKALIEWASK